MKCQPSWGRGPDVILGVWPANCRPSWGRCLYAGFGVWSARCQPSWGRVLSAIFGAWSAIFQPSWGRGHFIFGGGALGLVAILRGAWPVACPPFLWAWSLHFWGTCKLSAILGGRGLDAIFGVWSACCRPSRWAWSRRTGGHLGGRGPAQAAPSRSPMRRVPVSSLSPRQREPPLLLWRSRAANRIARSSKATPTTPPMTNGRKLNSGG